MNKKQTIGCIILLLLISAVSIQAQTTKKKDWRNISDYFELYFPEFEKDGDGRTLPKPKFKVRDTKNGYLELNDKANTTLALFRDKNGDAILVVSKKECDLVCSTKVEAYELDEGESDIGMMPITSAVIPKLSDRENLAIYKSKRNTRVKQAEEIAIYHILPRRGRVIEVVGKGEDGKALKLYELHFKDYYFVIVR